ncbi:membrane hypothetical protein [Vibrio nigripulchritudo SOn1]|uniref:Permease of the major facilitator superfamily n=1 Tax=Vibrio nigripulchritudo SOn1 TaxID=1238450 RepID=A0AAV2VZD8_9VIBR|nr:hypothetical protein [Vibrio nigripulchritudo]CCO49771.1 membrane hypothetical protein [Vibrio nigripulchritudo SOn1]
MIKFSTSYTLFCILNEISLLAFPLLAAYHSNELSNLFGFVSIYEFLISLFFGVIIGYFVDHDLRGSIYLSSTLLLSASLLFIFAREHYSFLVLVVIFYGFGKAISSSIFSKLTKLISDDKGDYKILSELNVKIRSLVDIFGPLLSAIFIAFFSEEMTSTLMTLIVLFYSYLIFKTKLPQKVECEKITKVKVPTPIKLNIATVSIWNLGYCALYINISYFIMSKGEDFIFESGVILSCVGIGGMLAILLKKLKFKSVFGLLCSLLWSSFFYLDYGFSQALFNMKSMEIFYEVVEQSSSSYLFGLMSSINSLALLTGAYVAINYTFTVEVFSFFCFFFSLVIHIITLRKVYDWKNSFSIKYSS